MRNLRRGLDDGRDVDVGGAGADGTCEGIDMVGSSFRVAAPIPSIDN